MLRQDNPPTDSVVVKANWSDNPWFPDVLKQEREDCLRDNPEQYDHIWEGGYVTVASGAYFARHLAQAQLENRIGQVAADPLLTYRVFVDIGGTGAKADAFTMWVAQFVGPQIRVLDYYEAQGQELSAHLFWLRSKGYVPENTKVWLPHDGATQDRVFNVSYQSALESAGYKVVVVPNQGKGAAMKRIEEARRRFPNIWFNEETTEPGRDALGWYHERLDETRNIGLGPEHDWASHAADAFGLMCIAHEEPKSQVQEIKFAGWGT
jgi:phage terminase large subunit